MLYIKFINLLKNVKNQLYYFNFIYVFLIYLFRVLEDFLFNLVVDIAFYFNY